MNEHTLVATARDPVAAETGRTELSVIVSPFGLATPSGFRRRVLVQPTDLRRLSVSTLIFWGETASR